MTIGEKIRKYRLENGLTQKQLGDACIPPIAESNIRKYELNKQHPKLGTLFRISTALNVPLYKISDIDFKESLCNCTIFNEQNLTIEKMDNNQFITNEEKNILFHFRMLNFEGRNEAIKRICELTELKKYTTIEDINGNLIDLVNGLSDYPTPDQEQEEPKEG